MLKADIDSDLKSAMVGGDKRLVQVLRSLKSAILYKEVEDGKREEGLNDEGVVAVLKKERKSRMDASVMYKDAGATEKADEEDYQIEVIEKYLPEALSKEETEKLVNSVAQELGIGKIEMKHIGQIMGALKQKNSAVEGSVVSQVIREQM